MIADIDPIASETPKSQSQAEVERLRLALLKTQANLFAIQSMSKVIGLTHCDPMFEQAQKTITEALNP